MTEDRRRADIERIMEPLKANMPEAGDFGFEAIHEPGCLTVWATSCGTSPGQAGNSPST